MDSTASTLSNESAMKWEKFWHKKHTFREMKNKLNDNKADVRQYEHVAPEKIVLRMYKKYALAAAIEVELPSKIKRP